MSKNNSLFRTGFFCGRLQHIHLGHQRIIQMGLDTCDTLLILIGSSQEQGTERNPFTYDFRKFLIEQCYPGYVESGRIIIAPIPDLTNENDISYEWGRYVLNTTRKHLNGSLPGVMLYGNDENRNGWFDPKDVSKVGQIIVPRGILPISATNLRQHLVNDDYFAWKGYVSTKLHEHYEFIRLKLSEATYYRGLMN